MQQQIYEAKTRAMIAVMQAHIDGAPIEFSPGVYMTQDGPIYIWKPVEQPTWNWEIFSYRVGNKGSSMSGLSEKEIATIQAIGSKDTTRDILKKAAELV